MIIARKFLKICDTEGAFMEKRSGNRVPCKGDVTICRDGECIVYTGILENVSEGGFGINFGAKVPFVPLEIVNFSLRIRKLVLKGQAQVRWNKNGRAGFLFVRLNNPEILEDFLHAANKLRRAL